MWLVQIEMRARMDWRRGGATTMTSITRDFNASERVPGV